MGWTLNERWRSRQDVLNEVFSQPLTAGYKLIHRFGNTGWAIYAEPNGKPFAMYYLIEKHTDIFSYKEIASTSGPYYSHTPTARRLKAMLEEWEHEGHPVNHSSYEWQWIERCLESAERLARYRRLRSGDSINIKENYEHSGPATVVAVNGNRIYYRHNASGIIFHNDFNVIASVG